MFQSLYKHPDSQRDILGLIKKHSEQKKEGSNGDKKDDPLDLYEERIKNSAFKEKRVALTSRNH